MGECTVTETTCSLSSADGDDPLVKVAEDQLNDVKKWSSRLWAWNSWLTGASVDTSKAGSPGAEEVTVDEQGDIQRWTAKRRTALVLSIIRGETSAQEAARKHGLAVAEVESWMERAMAAMENQLRSRPREEDEQKDERIRQLERKVGQMALDMDILKEAARPYHPTAGRTSDE